jgi:hypothetical protein
MGDMADDIISGASCSWCGVYFKEEHGYPVVCKDCAKGNKAQVKQAGLQVAKHG